VKYKTRKIDIIDLLANEIQEPMELQHQLQLPPVIIQSNGLIYIVADVSVKWSRMSRAWIITNTQNSAEGSRSKHSN